MTVKSKDNSGTHSEDSSSFKFSSISVPQKNKKTQKHISFEMWFQPPII